MAKFIPRFCLIMLICFAIATLFVIFNFKSQPADPIHYPRRPEDTKVDCARLFAGDNEYAKKIASKRPILVPNEKLNLSCRAIRSRVLPPRNANSTFPIAFVKVVFTDYEFLEEQLAFTYSEENWYCFAPDKKATSLFRSRFRALAACLPNVLLSESEYNLDSSGHFMNHAHFDCLRQLAAKPWKYVILMQNHDVMIKSNAELVHIFQLLNGSNDWELIRCPNGLCKDSLGTNLGKLGICPNGFSQNQTKSCEKASLSWGKGNNEMSLSRQTVDFLLSRINFTLLMEELNGMKYGVDEILVHTIAVSPELRLPGGFTSKCLVNGSEVKANMHWHVTRLSHWSHLHEHCGSGQWRHKICIFGVEDLPFLEDSAYVMANKLMPSVDYAAISCIGEMLLNRSIDGLEAHPLKMHIYTGLQQVRFDRERSANPHFDARNFLCEVPKAYV